MPAEPAVKRAVAFIDGQNLFHSARATFGHTHPNYDVDALANRLCRLQGWQLAQVRFVDVRTALHVIRLAYQKGIGTFI